MPLKVIGPYVPVAGYGQATAIIVVDAPYKDGGGTGVCTLYGKNIAGLAPVAEEVRALLEKHEDVLCKPKKESREMEVGSDGCGGGDGGC